MSKKKLFTEPIPNSNEYVEVDGLTSEQQHRRDSIESYQAQILDLTQKLNYLLENCKHEVFWDDPAFLYTFRRCEICRHITEFI